MDRIQLILVDALFRVVAVVWGGSRACARWCRCFVDFVCCCRRVQYGQTALHRAAEGGRTELGLALLAVEGVDVNARSYKVGSVCFVS